MKKMNWRFIGIVFLWGLGIAVVISSLAFTEVQQRQVNCRSISISVDHDDENYFINESQLRSILFSAGDSLIGTRINKLPLSLLELLVRNNKYVSDADVSVDIAGNLSLSVQQRRPLLRVVNSNNQSYYLDSRGFKMPLSDLYSARVLVANGAIAEGYDLQNDKAETQLLRDLFFTAQVISKNEFWDAQTEQMYVEANNDIVLIPRMGDFKILLGDTSRLEQKLNNLEVFYKKALPKVGWDVYSKISVKYRGQVICTRKDAQMMVLPQRPDTLVQVADSLIKLNIEQNN
jgi:cell division protein FtsQ